MRPTLVFLQVCAIFFAACLPLEGQSAAPSGGDQLRFVVIVSRHGVRSPTGKTETLNRYSAQPWPTWSVPAGYLTPHGYQLMKLMGAWDRQWLVGQSVLQSSGCADAERITIVADSDQRTRETGKALAEGLLPNCTLAVKALAEGTNDPLFHPRDSALSAQDKATAVRAIEGRIGANPAALATVYRSQLEKLQQVLRVCPQGAPCPNAAPLALVGAKASVDPGKGDHPADLISALTPAATMTENMLLEYAENMDATQVGWGQVDVSTLRTLLDLHTASQDYQQRTPFIARMQASNMLFHVLRSMEQASKGSTVEGALSRPQDRLLILSGHDTNLANIAGLLGLNWIVDGRRDDTPPGGAIVFKLWKQADGSARVRLFYTAQTLDQMRKLTPLTAENPPERAPLFLSACGQADGACAWSDFQKTINSAIDARFVHAGGAE